MPDSLFIGYLGPSDFHDGSILAVERQGAIARVRIRGVSGKEYLVEYRGVASLRSKNPVGMLLYAMAEFRQESPLRRFVFANWDDEDAAFLEVDAETFAVTDVQPGEPDK